MEPRQEQLAVLHRLQSEGQITATEYAHLAAGLGAPFVSEPEPEETDTETPAEETVTPDEEEWAGFGLPAPRLREGTTGSSIALVGVLGLGLMLAGATGLIPWLFAFFAIAVLATTLIEGWRLVTNIGAVVLAAVVVIGVVSSFGATPEPQPTVTATTPPVATPEPEVPGSLGLYMDQIGDTWNTLEGEPRITKGLTRFSESGEYDTFVYRFGEWGRLAGAHDRETDAVYALMASGWLSEPATSQFYLRLCFMTAPYSQECVDSYLEHGLGDIVLEELEGTHRSEWNVGDHSWRLTIEGNLMTIRVFGADAA